MRPKSIAIIPDGNRRFASRNALGVRGAYAQGFRKVEEVLEWARKAGIGSVTFWALSLENYERRSRFELRILFGLMRSKLREALGERTFERRKIRVKFFGKLSLLPEDLREMISELERRTANYGDSLSIALAYSGREEILNAAKKIAVDFSGKEKDAAKLTEGEFEKYLYAPASPDLIIRTGGVSRLSGFLPWQTAYSELYFSRKLWPEFGEADFEEALEFYRGSERRFGK